MNQVNVILKSKSLGSLPQVKVGDRVEFQIGEETLTDTVTYVMGHVVEGKRWDLTYIKFRVSESPAGRETPR